MFNDVRGNTMTSTSSKALGNLGWKGMQWMTSAQLEARRVHYAEMRAAAAAKKAARQAQYANKKV